jgi:hypothetical protein
MERFLATAFICFFTHKYEDSLFDVHGGAPTA